jgi:hypothetical protein
MQCLHTLGVHNAAAAAAATKRYDRTLDGSINVCMSQGSRAVGASYRDTEGPLHPQTQPTALYSTLQAAQLSLAARAVAARLLQYLDEGAVRTS